MKFLGRTQLQAAASEDLPSLMGTFYAKESFERTDVGVFTCA